MCQTNNKVSLAYSTVAQMGFMLLQCGLGAFSTAVLHLIAHSLYKAHAFLSSGSVVDHARAQSTPATRAPRPGAVLASFALALVGFVFAARVWGVSLEHEPALVVLGAVVVFGVTHLVLRASVVDHAMRFGLVVRATLTGFAASLVYFGLQRGAAALLAGVVPEPGRLEPSPATLTVMGLAVLGFGIATAVQWLGPQRRTSSHWQRAYVLFKHGLHAELRLAQLFTPSSSSTR